MVVRITCMDTANKKLTKSKRFSEIPLFYDFNFSRTSNNVLRIPSFKKLKISSISWAQTPPTSSLVHRLWSSCWIDRRSDTECQLLFIQSSTLLVTLLTSFHLRLFYLSQFRKTFQPKSAPQNNIVLWNSVRFQNINCNKSLQLCTLWGMVVLKQKKLAKLFLENHTKTKLTTKSSTKCKGVIAWWVYPGFEILLCK